MQISLHRLLTYAVFSRKKLSKYKNLLSLFKFDFLFDGRQWERCSSRWIFDHRSEGEARRNLKTRFTFRDALGAIKTR